MFEPFFTTKAPGRGTGLGLATVFGITKQSGGYVWIRSAPGAGTEVEILLPRVEKALPARSRPAPPAEGLEGAGEAVLLVEDDDAVRSLAVLVLESRGYRVFPALSPADALDRLERGDPPALDLLVTDMVLPGMNGQKRQPRPRRRDRLRREVSMRKRLGILAWVGAPAVVVAGFMVVGYGGLPFGEDLSGLPLAERFERGADWEEYVAAMDGELAASWRELYDGAWPSVAPVVEALEEVVEPSGAAAGGAGVRRLLVVTESWCGDSRYTVPYLARLAAASERVELRIIGKRDAPDVLEAYALEDGRQAIPVVVVLHEGGGVRGAWVEQPAGVREMMEEERRRGRGRGILHEKWQRWHHVDAGRSMLAEVLALLR